MNAHSKCELWLTRIRTNECSQINREHVHSKCFRAEPCLLCNLQAIGYVWILGLFFSPHSNSPNSPRGAKHEGYLQIAHPKTYPLRVVLFGAILGGTH